MSATTDKPPRYRIEAMALTAADVVRIDPDGPVRAEPDRALHAREVRDECQVQRLFVRVGKGRELERDPPVAVSYKTRQKLDDLRGKA